MTRQPTPGLHENFAEEAAMSTAKAMVTEPVAWQCNECGCRTYARVDAQQGDGSFAPGPEVRCVECKRVSAHPPAKREAGENWQIEYEVVMKDGDFCASSTDLNDAMHYAAMYSDDGPVEIVEVRRRTLEASHE